MLRGLLREILPNWRKQEVLRGQPQTGSLAALASLQRRIRMADKEKPQVRKPEAPSVRSEKHDPDRKDTAGGPKAPETSGAPPRDTHEWPSDHPEGEKKTAVTPRPTEKPVDE